MSLNVKTNGSLVRVDDSTIVSNYSNLTNLPTINGVEVKGTLTSSDLGLNGTIYQNAEPTGASIGVVWVGEKTL